MKPTKVTNLIGIALGISVAGFFVIQQMVGNGLPAPTSQLNIILIQPSLALILFLSAMPIIRYRSNLKKFSTGKAKRPKPVDSTYAIRTLAFAKSVSLTGSIFVGWQVAIVVYQLLAPQATSILNPILGIAGALTMAVAGIIVENLLRIPPDRENEAK